MNEDTPEEQITTPAGVVAGDPAMAARVRASFESQGLMRLLAARLTLVEPGRVHVALERRPEVSQQHGYVHAGATSAIADSAGGYAALTLMPPTSEVLTVGYTLNLLAPATGDYLEAVGTVLKSGRTLTVCRLDVFSVNGDERKLVAAGQQTLISVPSSRA
ncbi:MAG TPA: PaaI family thioesterase [Nocardioides sp.]|uniref:PaaI family thioesterase n=1 Tax=Nocardioides sp. TaxID=35761 RepID=UPI002BCA0BC9|nr:PaaI family thioesterase [Nocardioides sp.]HQR25536.1 PaaI family thioesterase [Nocardioides sp.]